MPPQTDIAAQPDDDANAAPVDADGADTQTADATQDAADEVDGGAHRRPRRRIRWAVIFAFLSCPRWPWC